MHATSCNILVVNFILTIISLSQGSNGRTFALGLQFSVDCLSKRMYMYLLRTIIICLLNLQHYSYYSNIEGTNFVSATSSPTIICKTVGTVYGKGGPTMATINGPGGPYVLPWMVWGDR